MPSVKRVTAGNRRPIADLAHCLWFDCLLLPGVVNVSSLEFKRKFGERVQASPELMQQLTQRAFAHQRTAAFGDILDFGPAMASFDSFCPVYTFASRNAWSYR